MQLDRVSQTLFSTIGRKATEKLARGVPPIPNATPDQIEAALHLARLARQYLKEKFHLVLILSEGQILDEVRMDQYVAGSKDAKPRVNPPMLEDLRPTTKVRDSIGRSSKPDKGQQAERRAEKQGRVPFTLDGHRMMLPPDVVEALRKAYPDA